MQMTFKDFEKLLRNGYAPDNLSIDRILIENNSCPHCKQKLSYRGISTAVRYRAFGVCEKCDYAREFWMEAAVFNRVKKKFCASRRANEKAGI